MPMLAFRFDIDRAGGGFYGVACYKALFQAVSLWDLEGMILYDGDSQRTLSGQENTYVIALQSGNPVALAVVRAAVEQHPAFTAIAANPPVATFPVQSPDPLVLCTGVKDGALTAENSIAQIGLRSMNEEKARAEQSEAAQA